MGKTLNIIPSGTWWRIIVKNWIGNEPDKANHEVIQYPVPTNFHYLPEALTDVEMMKTAISWHKPDSYPVANLYQELMNFIEIVNKWPEYEKVIVWHAEDEDDYFDAKHFSRYVNFRNRKRFPSPDYDGHHFWCKAQRLRFDKAWNILWEMFRTKLLTWND